MADAECCFAAKTETWVDGPDTRWEWYLKKGDTEQLENVVVGAGGAACCEPESTCG